MTNPLAGFRTAIKTAAKFFIAGLVLITVLGAVGNSNPSMKNLVGSYELLWQILGLVLLIGIPTTLKHYGNAYLAAYMLGTVVVLYLGFIDLLEFVITIGTGMVLFLIRFGEDIYG